MTSRQLAGFTMIELVITISVLGVLAALAGVLVKPTIDGYFAAQRRAELSDIADTGLRRMARDIRLALPNSVRTTVVGAEVYVELLLTRNGGRYRAQNDDGTAAGEDLLDFTVPDTAFDTLGPLVTAPAEQLVAVGDYVVVHNLGIAGANAYALDNASDVTGYSTAPGGGAAANEHRISISAKQFPLQSPGQRFFVISGPVSFRCTPGAVNSDGDGTGTLRRYSSYAIAAAHPTPPASATLIEARLANYVTLCDIQYTPLPLQARGLVSVRLGLTRANETVNLYHEAHVNNVP